MNRASLPALVLLAAAAGCHPDRGRTAEPPVPLCPSAVPPSAAPPAQVPAAAAPSIAPAAPAPERRIAELRIIDDARAWILADGRAWETRDGGKALIDRTPFARPAAGDTWHELWSLVATSSAVVLLRGDEELAPSMSLFASTDGGASFVERAIPRLQGGRGARLQAGPAAGSLLILREDGGGMNSHAQSVLFASDEGARPRALGTTTGYGAITFQTATTWWTVGSCCAEAPSVYRSVDGGRSWARIAAATDDWEPLAEMIFIDAARGYRVVRAGESPSSAIERTTDGGRSFTRVEPPVPSSDVLHAGPDACVLLGEQGVPVMTRDLGRTWATLAPLPAGVASPRLERAPHAWWAVTDTGGATSVILVLRDDAPAWERLAPVWDDGPTPPRP